VSAEPKRVQSVDPSRLADLIELDAESRTLWNGSDLKSILAHQLATKILPDLTKIHPGFSDESFDADSVKDLTFGQALTDPNAPIELLKLIKDFAKVHWHSKSSGLPKEIAMVLYYAAIASGMNHGHGSITKLSPEDLKRGMQRVLDQNWVNDEIKAVVRNVLSLDWRSLGASGNGQRPRPD